MTKKENGRIHLVNLFKWRSLTTLFACLLTLLLTAGSFIYAVKTDDPEIVNTQFQWFTIDSNLFTALSAMMVIPFAIVGIQKKRMTLPKWALLIHYAGVINTTLTMVFVLGFISTYDPELAFGQENFFLHIICPFLVLISFFMIESIHPLNRKDNLLGLIPFTIYVVLYCYNVVFAGNWADHYLLNTLVPFYVSMPLVFLLAYIIGFLIRSVHNRLLKKHERQLKMIWDEDLDPQNVKTEIYSLGTHAGLYEDKDSVSIPYDILEDLSRKFDIPLEELSSAFNKGVIDGMKEKDRKRHKDKD